MELIDGQVSYCYSTVNPTGTNVTNGLLVGVIQYQSSYCKNSYGLSEFNKEFIGAFQTDAGELNADATLSSGNNKYSETSIKAWTTEDLRTYLKDSSDTDDAFVENAGNWPKLEWE